MKIGNNAEINTKPKVGGAAAGQAEGATATGVEGGAKAAKTGIAQPEAGSTVAISNAARSLISGTGSDDGSFDAEKVSRIAAAIEKGEFKINADAIADKLIANATEMLGKTQASH